MKAPTLAFVCLLMTASFAGCFADDDADPASTQGTSNGDGANATLPTGNATGNTAPTIVVTILVNGTEVALANDSYAVPSGENITFDASASSDAEGGNLTFAWDFGDGNTSTEAVAVYAYSAAGNFTVNLTVTDVDGASASEELPLVAAPSGPAPGSPLGVEKQTFKGTLTVGLQTTACGAGSGGSKTHDFVIPAVDAATGAGVLVTQFVLKMTGDTTNVDSDLEFYGVDGKLIKSSTGASATETINVEGSFPAGKYVVKIVGCIAVNAAYTVNAEATKVAA